MEKLVYEKPTAEVLLIAVSSTVLTSPGEHEGNEGNTND